MATKEFLRSLAGTHEAPSMSGMWYGIIVEPVPPTLADYIYVKIPDIDPNVKFGPCRWPTTESPTAGREVLVVFDNRQHPWVVSIW